MLRFSHALLLGVLATVFLVACGEKINPKRDPIGAGGAPGEAGTAEPVSYAQTIAPMMNASCAVSACHNSSDKLLGYVLDTHEGLVKDLAEVNDSIQQRRMPIPPGADMSEAQRRIFQDWVSQGALKN